MPPEQPRTTDSDLAGIIASLMWSEMGMTRLVYEMWELGVSVDDLTEDQLLEIVLDMFTDEKSDRFNEDYQKLRVFMKQMRSA